MPTWIMKKKKKISFLEFFYLILNDKDAFSKLANYFRLWISRRISGIPVKAGLSQIQIFCEGDDSHLGLFIFTADLGKVFLV